MRTITLISLLAILASCASAQDAATTTTTIYQANYVARYTYVLDYLCKGPLPELRLECPSEGATLVLEGIQNDPDIQCTSVTENEMLCAVSSCPEEGDCSVVNGGSADSEDDYGNVYFRCEGPSVADTYARFTYLGSEDVPAECDDNVVFVSIFTASDNRVFHIHQLGVFCPDQGIEGEFVFAGQFAECPGQSGRNLDVGYICGDGQNCNFEACTFELKDSTMVSQVDVIEESSCITTRTNTEEVQVPPSAPPTPPEYPVGLYSTRYQAQWRVRELGSFCTIPLPVVRVKCLDGQLMLISTLYEETECTMISESEMECRETCSTCDYYKFDQFRQSDWGAPFEGGGAIYECVDAAQPPLSEVEYQASTYECCDEDNSCYSSISTEIDSADHAVYLGMYCGSQTAGGEYYGGDIETDCSPYGEQEDMFIIEGVGPEDSTQVVCSARIPSPINVPAASDPFTFELPPIMVYSQTHARGDECFDFTEDPNAPTNPPSGDEVDLDAIDISRNSTTSTNSTTSSNSTETEDIAEDVAATGTGTNLTDSGTSTASAPAPSASESAILSIPVAPP